MKKSIIMSLITIYVIQSRQQHNGVILNRLCISVTLWILKQTLNFMDCGKLSKNEATYKEDSLQSIKSNKLNFLKLRNRWHFPDWFLGNQIQVFHFLVNWR